MSDASLPPIAERVSRDFPDVWAAYSELGGAVAQAGPLDAKTQKLVKLALAAGAKLEGAVHAHVRRGLKEGLSPDELRHVAILAVTTLGWPSAMAALTWIEDVVGKPT
jgi:alkylhydroperoxidase/carboxymuconolactone decarboxylase family protein YurZ